MAFRKIFFAFTLLIFGNWGIGQMDSTDLNFYAVQEDSLADGNFQQLFVEFDLDESLSISLLKIEVVYSNTYANATTSFQGAYTASELNTFLISAEMFKLDLGTGIIGFNYQVFVTFIDSSGHEIISISKFLVL